MAEKSTLTAKRPKPMAVKVMVICGLICFAFNAEAQAQFPVGGKSSAEKELRKEQKAAKRAAKEEARRKKEMAMLHDADYMEEVAFEVEEAQEKQAEEKETEPIIKEKRERKPRTRPEPRPKQKPFEKVEEKEEIEDYSSTFAMETYAKSFQGVPYRMGGTDSKGFDCSGFTSTVYSHVDIPLPRTAQSQYDACKEVPLKKAEKGDLVFFGKSKNRISHVGLVLSAPGEELMMIHSSSSQGIVITNVEQSSYWKNKLIGVGRMDRLANK